MRAATGLLLSAIVAAGCGGPLPHSHAADDGTCASDGDCNGYDAGSDTVCGQDGTCIPGCHADTDCAAGLSCQNALPDGTCALGTLSIGATQGNVAVSGTVQISGRGSNQLGGVEIDSNVGQIVFEGNSLPAVAYAVQSFSGYSLFQLLAVGPSNLVVAWAYCVNGSISGFYRESTAGDGVVYEQGAGSCSTDGVATNLPVSLPAVSLAAPPLLAGVTIDGPAVSYDGQDPGTLTLGGVTYAFLPFNTVNCETTCGTPGWTEVHSLLWDPLGGNLCFVIVYLNDSAESQIQAAWGLCLPSLGEVNQVLPATWTHP